jgi:hypothetical protein
MSPPRSNSPSLTGSYESDHSSNHDDTYGTNEPASSSQYQKPTPCSDHKHLKGKGAKPSRPTHFLCFPLVTEISVPQLAESLGKFRAITTAPPVIAQPGVDDTPEREIDGPGTDVANGTDDRLKIIPSSAHRPPGTFHLTIGTMDLSQKSEMLRAVKALKSLDYNAILQKVDQQLASSRSLREIALDATEPTSTSKLTSTPAAAINTQPSTVANNGLTSNSPKPAQPASPPAPTKDSYRSTVSKIDRAILHATPDTRDIKAYKASSAQSPKPTQSPTSPPQPTPTHRRELSQLSQNYHQRNSSQESAISHLTTSSIAPSIAQSTTSYAPSIASSVTATGDTVQHGNRYGVSGYKETVSTIDRYVDKTYDTAQKAKMKAKQLRPSEMRERIRSRGSRKNTLESLRREVSPPGRQGSFQTERRRLLDDGGSLYTVATNTTVATTATDATERPSNARSGARPASALDERPASSSPQFKANEEAAAPSTSTTSATAAMTACTTTNGESDASPPTNAKPNPITISLSGLGTFPSPSKARVFYAPPSSPASSPFTSQSSPQLDQAARLIAFANEIKTTFMQQGILRNEGRDLVLHATVANMSKATSSGFRGKGGKGRWRARQETVDAREVLEYFNGSTGNGSGTRTGSAFTWAEGIVVDRVRICKMGAIKADVVGGYMEAVDREVLGMVYPAIEIDDSEGQGEGAGEAKLMVKAEILFG